MVIESDDWGSIRMPSKNAYESLIKSGIAVDSCAYNTFDTLETTEDIEEIIKFCRGFCDSLGNPLKITTNFIMANPDFNKIKESKFKNYYFKDLLDTYEYYQGENRTFQAITYAIGENVFFPQLHGREHLQVNHWLKALMNGDKESINAFDQDVWGHPSNYEKVYGINFSSAFHINSESELNFCKQSVIDASDLFYKSFGFRSETFIAPRFIWPKEMERTLYQSGIRALQGKLVQLKPEIGLSNNKLKNKINWMGKSNSSQLQYLIRNVFFEPSQKPSFSWELDAMNRIDTAFFWGKPAVISMHRLNFMGGLSVQNRKNCFERLGGLINSVQKKYPNIEFLSSNELYHLLYGK
ncbi:MULTISPECIES: hypothetical protein [Rhodonellum]|nr:MULTISPECIES: hypothetical protein [Rhodonellum]SDZ40624.1 hypothetical protein SAMN05444412_11346 [Rhodonellum ikkaensis]